MSTITRQTTAVEANAEEPWVPHRFSVEDYHEMGRVGILGPDDRVELLEGCVVTNMNFKPPHAMSLMLCEQAIRRALSDEYHVRNQLPVTTEDSEPEPDLAAIRGAIRDFGERHPASEDTPLLVEVSDTSLQVDRKKRRIYGRAGFATFWIVNLNETQIEVYTDPTGPTDDAGYKTERVYKPGQQVPLLIDGNEIAKIEVKDLLP